VLPNGVLGNPGADAAAVRWWMLRNMELLASVDLPGEAFLPQVSVQASCVFLRRRHPDELRHRDEGELAQGPAFMAIAERVGHDRRGNTITERGDDGAELVFTDCVRERWEEDGTIREQWPTRTGPRVGPLRDRERPRAQVPR